MGRSILSTIILCSLFSSCSKHIDQQPGRPSLFSDTPEEVYGTWSYTSLFYRSTISLSKDGRFEFLESGCTGSSFSAGAWAFSGGQITLNSDPGFAIEEHENFKFESKSIVIKPDSLHRRLAKGIKMPDFRMADVRIVYTGVTYTDTMKVNLVSEKLILKQGRLIRESGSDSKMEYENKRALDPRVVKKRAVPLIKASIFEQDEAN